VPNFKQKCVSTGRYVLSDSFYYVFKPERICCALCGVYRHALCVNKFLINVNVALITINFSRKIPLSTDLLHCLVNLRCMVLKVCDDSTF
jgi:hypothetical protein